MARWKSLTLLPQFLPSNLTVFPFADVYECVNPVTERNDCLSLLSQNKFLSAPKSLKMNIPLFRKEILCFWSTNQSEISKILAVLKNYDVQQKCDINRKIQNQQNIFEREPVSEPICYDLNGRFEFDSIFRELIFHWLDIWLIKRTKYKFQLNILPIFIQWLKCNGL